MQDGPADGLVDIERDGHRQSRTKTHALPANCGDMFCHIDLLIWNLKGTG